MHLTVSRQLTIRTGDYESVQLRAEFGCTHRDFGVSDDQLAERLSDDWLAERPSEELLALAEQLQSFVRAQLDAALGEDIVDAALVADRKSFVHLLVPTESAPPAPPARTARRRRTQED